jgi:hypothetical protein
MYLPFIKWYVPACMLLLSYIAAAQQDTSQTCAAHCCQTDPTPSGIMISHIHKKHEWMFSYRYMHMSMGNMQSGTQKVSDNTVFQNYLMSSISMHMDMHMLMAMYGLTNKLTLMGMVSYNVNSMIMSMLPGTQQMQMMDGMTMGTAAMDMHMTTSGFGDIKLNALYGLINNINHHLLVSGGVSIPTGSLNNKGKDSSMYAGTRLPYIMQLGSGTWDVLPVISYLYRKGNIAWSSQLSGVVRTGNNNFNYKLGNEATFNNWVSLRWSRFFSSTARVEGYISDRIHGQDASLYANYEPSANPLNYGGRRVSGFVGTSFYPGFFPNSRIAAEYGIPFYQYLNGPQMKLRSALNLSLNLLF